MDNIDRVVEQTTKAISNAIDRMVKTLPEDAAPQMAIELVVRRLAHKQQWIMTLIMEDADIREAFAEAIAEIPATTSSEAVARRPSRRS